MAGYTKERKIVTAERLKKLREGKNLSHAALADLLHEKYGKNISRDVLINYEISEPNHSKFDTGFGMRIEYIANLADFYKVSVDYLLGMSDTKSIDKDVISACNYTHLSESALENLVIFLNETSFSLHAKIISYMFENGYIQDIANLLCNSLISSYEYKLIYNDITEKNENEILVSTHELEFNKFAIHLYMDIQERLSSMFLPEIKEIVSADIENLKCTAKKTMSQMEYIINNLEAKNKSTDEQEAQAKFIRKLIEKQERGQK